LDELVATAPVMAARTRNYARAAFSWATLRELVSTNSFASVEVEGRERSRDRMLTDAEVGEAWRAAGELGQPWRAYFWLTILTLQRRGEVAGMKKSFQIL
jgi:integrase